MRSEKHQERLAERLNKVGLFKHIKVVSHPVRHKTVICESGNKHGKIDKKKANSQQYCTHHKMFTKIRLVYKVQPYYTK